MENPGDCSLHSMLEPYAGLPYAASELHLHRPPMASNTNVHMCNVHSSTHIDHHAPSGVHRVLCSECRHSPQPPRAGHVPPDACLDDWSMPVKPFSQYAKPGTCAPTKNASLICLVDARPVEAGKERHELLEAHLAVMVGVGDVEDPSALTRGHVEDPSEHLQSQCTHQRAYGRQRR